MVEYNYENLFAEHFAANILVVDSGATVTIVPGAHPIVSGELFKIENEQLKAESFKLSESLCSNPDLTFGKMEASKVTFSFKNSDSLPTDLSDKEIDIYLYFNWDSSSLFKVGRYIVENDKYSENNFVRNITAYDMNYYLKDTDITSWYYGYYGDGQKHMLGFAIVNLFNWLRDPNDDYEDSPKINIQLENGYNLCNALFAFGQTIESDSISFEYYMQRVLEWNGCFGHINRKGNFEFVVMQWYDKEPVRTVTNEDRIPPTEHDIVSTWGIGGVDVYDRDNVRICKYRNTSKKHPSIYSIADSFVTAEYEKGDSTLKEAVKKLHNVIHHLNYKPCNVKTVGDLCVEVGDRINVNVLPDEGESRGWFRSYCLERTFSGIQGMIDKYRSKGDKKQPKYVIDQSTSHTGDSDQAVDGSDGVTTIDDEHDRHFCEIIRNLGYRVLNEPSDVECKYDDGNMNVKFKWTDPDDFVDAEPETATWAGTIVVRKEGSRPLHEWDGDVIVDSITRDAYKNTYLVDNTIEEDKQYYYGIFPYHIKNGKRWTRFTKVISVNTSQFVDAPEITGLAMSLDQTKVLVNYTVPSATYSYIKLVYKQGSIPIDKDDGTAIDITQASTSQIISGIADGNTYWFVIFTDKTSSDAESITTIDIVPSDLRPYVDKMSLTSWGSSDQLTLLAYSCLSGNSNTYTIDDLYSYYVQDGNFSDDANAYDFYILSNCTISVSTESGITVTYDINIAPTDLVTVSGRSMWGPYSYTGNYTGNQYGYIGSTFGDRTGVSILGAASEFTGNPTTSFSTLLECMQYLAQHFRHCNLKVDGVYWLNFSEESYQHLFDTVNMNSQSVEYTFDTALTNWYEAGLSEQTSHISGSASSHISLTNSFYKIDNYPFTEHSGTIDFGGGWTFEYAFGEVTHTYNRDVQQQAFTLKYNGNTVKYYSMGGTTSSEYIITFEDNGDETASILLFHSVGEYMYDQIYDWSTYADRIKTTDPGFLNYIWKHRS